MAGFLLNTDFNNQKILLNTQQTLNVGSPNYSGTYTFNHNLGYIPVARVWFEAEPGRWFVSSTKQYDGGSSGSGYVELMCSYGLTTSSITVEVRNLGIAYSTCNIWVRIYLDD